MKALRCFVPSLAFACLVVQPLLAAANVPVFIRDATFPAKPAAATHSRMHRDQATNQNIGSGNVVFADQNLPRVNEKPCVAPLFTNQTLTPVTPLIFKYRLPLACPGPYAQIVFNGTFSVAAGVLLDRTVSVEVNNVPLYLGTTAEPTPTLGPSWHVARDVTDEASLFTHQQSGEADIKVVNALDTGAITATATLEFYPAAPPAIPPATSPDLVYAFPNLAGGPQLLPTGTTQLSATYTLPTNVDSAYLDVYTQSQNVDEQFFNCAPGNVAAELFACPNSPIRLTEVTIDGVPAGLAPVYPLIFTGGLDPYLWAPIPGVQTLEFRPYRVNLTPFASVLANGLPHTIALFVQHADNYFQAFGTLLAYEDHGSTAVTGAITNNTLKTSSGENTVENLSLPPSVDGTIAVSVPRTYDIAGNVNTSTGLVSTDVSGTLQLINHQSYSNESTLPTGTFTAQATTTANTVVTTVTPAGTDTVKDVISFPLNESIVVAFDGSGNGTRVTTLDQLFLEQKADIGLSPSASYESNEVRSTDTANYANSVLTGNSNQASSQLYEAEKMLGNQLVNCYDQSIAAAANLVTAVSPPACNQFAARRRLSAMLRR
jgi:hypothetical protein